MDPRLGDKRKHTHARDNQHHAKRPRNDTTNPNGNGVSRYANTAVKLPKPLPPLPSIAQEYATPTFTHMSKSPNDISQCYDRLECLGDSYIEIISTRLIFSRYPKLPSGRMSSIREMMVKNETLNEYSLAYGFEKRIIIEPAQIPTNRTVHLKLHADVFEAYVGAIVLSEPIQGFEIAEDWLTALWEPLLKDVQGEPPSSKWKDELRKKIGVKGVRLDYIDERPPIMGRGIETYFIGVYLTGLGYDNQHLGSGQALSKKQAGMEAAEAALKNRPLIDELSAKAEKVRGELRAERDREAA